MQPTESEIEQIKAKHADRELHETKIGDDTFIISAPTPPQWRRFMKLQFDKDKRDLALVTLTQDCTLWPEPREFSAVMNRRPALGELLGNEIAQLGGVSDQATTKKL